MPAWHHGEDPFFWVDGRKNWHALFHSSAPSASGHGTHCASSGVASHLFSSDNGKTWDGLNPQVQPYLPSVVWDDESSPHGYATMERPHLYSNFDISGPSCACLSAPHHLARAV